MESGVLGEGDIQNDAGQGVLQDRFGNLWIRGPPNTAHVGCLSHWSHPLLDLQSLLHCIQSRVCYTILGPWIAFRTYCLRLLKETENRGPSNMLRPLSIYSTSKTRCTYVKGAMLLLLVNVKHNSVLSIKPASCESHY